MTKHPHFWFVGGTGTGKTTLAKSIADLPCVTLASNISQAFLHQLLTESARCAVVLDEVEGDTLSNLAEMIEQDPRGFAQMPSRLFAFSQSLPPLPPDILDEANVQVLLFGRMMSPPTLDEFLGVLDIEDDQEADARKLDGVLELAREAATGAVRVRGGSDGTASVMSDCQMFGSILTPPLVPHRAIHLTEGPEDGLAIAAIGLASAEDLPDAGPSDERLGAPYPVGPDNAS